MDSSGNSVKEINLEEYPIPLSRVDLMVTFHMLRSDFPGLSLAVRNYAFCENSGIERMSIDTVSDTITALCSIKTPESIELKQTMNKLLNRWISAEKVLQNYLIDQNGML